MKWHKSLFLSIVTAGLPFFLLAQEIASLQEYIEGLPPDVEVAFLAQDASGRTLFSHNREKKVPSASIIKIPILVELFTQVEEGRIKLHETYHLKDEDKVGGSGKLQHLPAGTKTTVEELAREMIAVSDNTATNILIGMIGMEAVGRRMRQLGLKNTELNRKMMDFEAITEGMQNYTSPDEINRLLLMLQKGEILSPLPRNLVMEMLINCEDKTTIPSKLPTNLTIAHKTGTLEYLRGDAAIILGRRPLILSVFVEHAESAEAAEEIIGTVAKLIWKEFTESPFNQEREEANP